MTTKCSVCQVPKTSLNSPASFHDPYCINCAKEVKWLTTIKNKKDSISRQAITRRYLIKYHLLRAKYSLPSDATSGEIIQKARRTMKEDPLYIKLLNRGV